MRHFQPISCWVRDVMVDDIAVLRIVNSNKSSQGPQTNGLKKIASQTSQCHKITYWLESKRNSWNRRNNLHWKKTGNELAIAKSCKCSVTKAIETTVRLSDQGGRPFLVEGGRVERLLLDEKNNCHYSNIFEWVLHLHKIKVIPERNVEFVC